MSKVRGSTGPTDVTLWQAPPSAAATQTREANGRFKAVSDDALIGDVATLRHRAPELVAAFADVKVGELRDLFGGLSVSKIAGLKAAERAVFLGIGAGTPAENAAQAATILALVAGGRPTAGAPVGGDEPKPARAPRGFDLAAARTSLTKNVRGEIDKRLKAFQRENPGAWQEPWVAQGLKLFVEAGDAAKSLQGVRETPASKRAAFEQVQAFELRLEAWIAGG
jgi:hypothetical protein